MGNKWSSDRWRNVTRKVKLMTSICLEPNISAGETPFRRTPIVNGPWGIEWSRHMTPKARVVTPVHLKVKYRKNNRRCYL